MIYAATREIDVAFESKGIKHRINEVGKFSTVEAGYTGDNVSGIIVRFISSDNDNDVGVRVLSYLKVPKDKRAQILECINTIHRDYRYAKFSIDNGDEIDISMDIPLGVNNVGTVAIELFYRICKIADDVYPRFMKAIWA